MKIIHEIVDYGYQQADHCAISAGGINWMIYKVEKMLLHIATVDQAGRVITAELDLSEVNMEEYCQHAVAWAERCHTTNLH